jgi:hypothetical protein
MSKSGRKLLSALRLAVAATVVSIAGTGIALAYVGNSYLHVPGVDGGWPGTPYKNWIKVNGHYWQVKPARLLAIGRKSQAFFSAPNAPREGGGSLVIALDKRDPVLPRLLEQCGKKAPIPELIYAESAERARSTFEIGPRPADIPEYFEYKLKSVLLSDCPKVADAPEQAIVVTFKEIEWVNYDRTRDAVQLKLEPAVLKPVNVTGKSQSFVLSWFAVAHDVSDRQCATLNSKPLEADYYALMPQADAAKERAQLASKGGVNYENGQMGMRGPRKLDVTMLPSIVRDPGHAEPLLNLARGIDLDGDDGKGSPAPGTCKHRNYESVDGRTGIDNQLYTVQGCVAGFQGHKGFILQFANNQMHDGAMSILLDISGIDDERNDDSVYVTLFYSLDPMAKSGVGGKILPDYTFRVTDNPDYTHYFSRMRAHIVDGVLTTDRLEQFQMNLGVYGTPKELTLTNAQMRLEFQTDGTIKGVIGGYQDWRKIASTYTTSTSEMYHGFQQPALYNSLKRAADGLQDPSTGECNGISSAYDIEGVPAFLPRSKGKELMTRSNAPDAKER